jgi:hypothetical protein
MQRLGGPRLSRAVSDSAKAEKQAPQVTLQALVIAVRQGGLAALDKSINKQRFSELSPQQKKELRMRLKQMVTA